MSNNFTVTGAIYNGSSSNLNPLITISGSVNGTSVPFGRCLVQWDAIQQANIVGGTSAVQQLLGPAMLNAVQFPYVGPFAPLPTFSANGIPAPVTAGGISSIQTVCNEALVGSWSA
jgi:hypothetical protein